ncbi:transglutaminase family protein [Marinibacterium profundimaris]|uniref:Transglutaminase n=1 Tax=Marinibacterium profundimaris TaxID=1679460 RepID=A0A225NHR0_9RHOB|nr:transglutaminase family protein [Marinibacterium profundimaris]OWU72494.1 transglutaminase [Marinibacterium profundimaris]
MLYDIRLTIRYSYQSPAAANRTVLRMQPLSGPDQRLVSGRVAIDPEPDFRQDGEDFFGNARTEVAYDGQLSEYAFRFAGRVDRNFEPGAFDLSCPLDMLARELADTHSIVPQSPHHFLGRSSRVRHSPEIAAFARDQLEPGLPVLETVARMSRALHSEIAFDPTATDVTTSAEEAFLARRGVCQDISHIMITALREVGIPAGYVSGFLRTEPPEGEARLDGADAMHAWIRAWCGSEMGWVEMDPTNDMRVGEDHITVAMGRDYADVAPVKGSLRTAGLHATSHSVDVVPVV